MTLSGNILIIDDEPNLRQTFTRILKQAGCNVTTAADGPEALKRLAGTVYDLAYLDIHLPGMDGLQVLKEIRRLYPQLPVILFTGHASLQSAMDAIRLGAVDYLLKPVDPENLLARTGAVLADQAKERRRRELQEHIAALQDELKALNASPKTPAALAQNSPHQDRYLKIDLLVLDLQTGRATFGEQALSLPPATFDYLVVLARHTPDTVSYQTLVSEAQGYPAERREAQELAKWHIYELRRALEPDPRQPRYIINIRGTGYRLVLD
ncbi:MAG TPA: response regulator transcription factor [Anaerolineales bacterium]|nr:response regulator transcription factor [Anaerolineales bacterium]